MQHAKPKMYCTVGRGMEPFCQMELQQIGTTLQGRVEGKLFFSLPATLPELRTAERLFISVLHTKQTLDLSNKAVASFHLQRLLYQVSWDDHVATWRSFHPQAPAGPLPTRINVRMSGKLRNILQPCRVARTLAQRLFSSYNLFKTCLRKPILTIDVHVSDLHITAGLALSLATRAIGGVTHGLRSTTASAMAMCFNMVATAQPSPSTIVLDPMCGKGALLYELTQYYIIGIDNDSEQLAAAKLNVPKAQLLIADATNLPLLSNTVDYIVCDIPFGVQYSTKSELKQLLPLLIKEMKRVLKSGGKVVLLTSSEQGPEVLNCVNEDWILENKYAVTLGLLDAVILIFTG